MKCFIDGSCEPVNPGGRMGMGVFIEDLDVYLKDFVEPSHHNTNNVAEYLALELLLGFLLDKGVKDDLQIYSDSRLLVNQMKGKWRIGKGAYVCHALKCRELLTFFKFRINWIPREENIIADELSKNLL